MSANFGRYTPVAGGAIDQDTGVPWEYIRIINSSPYLLSLSLGGQGTIDFPEMYLEDIPITKSYNGKIHIMPVSNIVNPSAALTNYVSINAYQPGEIKQPQAQPLTTMSNVGNSVPLSATATSVANDGNAAPVNVVEATESGHTSSDLLMTNDGQARVAGIKKSKGGGATFWSLFGWDGTNDNEALRVQTNGQLLAVQAMAFSPFTTFFGAINKFSGTGTGTFSHGLAITPTIVLAMQSVVGSQTMGWDTPTSSNVHITAAGGSAWVALAYAT